MRNKEKIYTHVVYITPEAGQMANVRAAGLSTVEKKVSKGEYVTSLILKDNQK